MSLRCTLLCLWLSYRLRLLLPLRGRCLLVLLEAVLGLCRRRRAIRGLGVGWLLWCCRRRWTFLCRWAGLLISVCPTFAAGFHLRPVRIYCGHRCFGSLKIPLHMVRHNGLLLLVSRYTGLHGTSLVNDLIAFRQNRMSLNAPGLMLLLRNAQHDTIKLLLRSGHELRKTLSPSCVTCLRAYVLSAPGHLRAIASHSAESAHLGSAVVAPALLRVAPESPGQAVVLAAADSSAEVDRPAVVVDFVPAAPSVLPAQHLSWADSCWRLPAGS